MIPESMKQIVLPRDVWNLAIDKEDSAIYFDIRDNGETDLARLSLSDFSYECKKVDNPWWTKLLMANSKTLTFIEYLDKQNPNKYRCFNLNWDSLEREFVRELNSPHSKEIIPHIYEHGSDYHKTVSEFLGLELPLSCEYLEWNDKIIISYYIRSDNTFERYLLLLENGKKKWKVSQDTQMQGFSSGAFFVFNKDLIFIKNRNEVCIYRI